MKVFFHENILEEVVYGINVIIFRLKCVKVSLINSIMAVNSADIMSLSWTKIHMNTVSTRESIPDPTNKRLGHCDV